MSESFSLARAAYLKKQRRQKIAVNLARVFLLFGILCLWELAGRFKWIDVFVFSCPSRVVRTLQSLLLTGDLTRHLGASCGETIIGFTLGTLVGTFVAVGLWWSKLPCSGALSGCSERASEDGAGSDLHRVDRRRNRKHRCNDARDFRICNDIEYERPPLTEVTPRFFNI